MPHYDQDPDTARPLNLKHLTRPQTLTEAAEARPQRPDPMLDLAGGIGLHPVEKAPGGAEPSAADEAAAAAEQVRFAQDILKQIDRFCDLPGTAEILSSSEIAMLDSLRSMLFNATGYGTADPEHGPWHGILVHASSYVLRLYARRRDAAHRAFQAALADYSGAEKAILFGHPNRS